MSRPIVTGAQGFIGKHLIRDLDSAVRCDTVPGFGIYASSASVYGLGENGFNEDALLTPLNYYAISKASFDTFVKQKIADHPNAKIVGLRYFNVYGTGENYKHAMASPVQMLLILQN